jgi:hypothetical protein
LTLSSNKMVYFPSEKNSQKCAQSHKRKWLITFNLV